jgi:hypothetical protein
MQNEHVKVIAKEEICFKCKKSNMILLLESKLFGFSYIGFVCKYCKNPIGSFHATYSNQKTRELVKDIQDFIRIAFNPEEITEESDPKRDKLKKRLSEIIEKFESVQHFNWYKEFLSVIVKEFDIDYKGINLGDENHGERKNN